MDGIVAETAFEDVADVLADVKWVRAPAVLATLMARTWEASLLAHPHELLALCEAAGLFVRDERGAWVPRLDRIDALTPERDGVL